MAYGDCVERMLEIASWIDELQNMRSLAAAIADAKVGRNMTEHELIEED